MGGIPTSQNSMVGVPGGPRTSLKVSWGAPKPGLADYFPGKAQVRDNFGFVPFLVGYGKPRTCGLVFFLRREKWFFSLKENKSTSAGALKTAMSEHVSFGVVARATA